MLFTLISEAISSVASSLAGTSTENASMFGPDFVDTSTNDTMFNEFDIGFGFMDDFDF